jgi:microcystin-dependent protein
MFDVRDSILFILIILTVYLIYKMKYKNNDNFESTDIINLINKTYNFEIDSFRNLGQFVNKLYNNQNMNIPTVDLNMKNVEINNITTTQPLLNEGILFYLPIYSIIMWNSNTIPNGWFLCDGTNTTPDLRNRFLLGASSTNTIRKLGDMGGAEDVVLSIDTLPSHTHGSNVGLSHNCFRNEGYASHYAANGFTSVDSITDASGGNSNNGNTTDPHNNMPPYFILNYIIKLSNIVSPTTNAVTTTI